MGVCCCNSSLVPPVVCSPLLWRDLVREGGQALKGSILQGLSSVTRLGILLGAMRVPVFTVLIAIFVRVGLSVLLHEAVEIVHAGRLREKFLAGAEMSLRGLYLRQAKDVLGFVSNFSPFV